MIDRQTAMERLHDDIRRQLKEDEKDDDEWVRIHTIENDDASPFVNVLESVLLMYIFGF